MPLQKIGFLTIIVLHPTSCEDTPMLNNDATAPTKRADREAAFLVFHRPSCPAPVLLTVYITWAAINLIDGQVASLVPGFSSFNSRMCRCRACYRGSADHCDRRRCRRLSGSLDHQAGESSQRMPVVRSIYGASKQILETVISTQSDAFREVVLVEYPRKELWVIGFVTGGTKAEVARRIDIDMVNVFVPTTPNPTSGFLLFCPREDVIFMDMSVEDAVKLVVSGGIVTPPDDGKPAAKGAATVGKKAASRKASAKKAAKKIPAKKAAKKTAA